VDRYKDQDGVSGGYSPHKEHQQGNHRTCCTFADSPPPAAEVPAAIVPNPEKHNRHTSSSKFSQ
jgi:hypothetical protein